jgi:hypothetical protein
MQPMLHSTGTQDGTGQEKGFPPIRHPRGWYAAHLSRTGLREISTVPLRWLPRTQNISRLRSLEKETGMGPEIWFCWRSSFTKAGRSPRWEGRVP